MISRLTFRRREPQKEFIHTRPTDLTETKVLGWIVNALRRQDRAVTSAVQLAVSSDSEDEKLALRRLNIYPTNKKNSDLFNRGSPRSPSPQELSWLYRKESTAEASESGTSAVHFADDVDDTISDHSRADVETDSTSFSGRSADDNSKERSQLCLEKPRIEASLETVDTYEPLKNLGSSERNRSDSKPQDMNKHGGEQTDFSVDYGSDHTPVSNALSRAHADYSARTGMRPSSATPFECKPLETESSSETLVKEKIESSVMHVADWFAQPEISVNSHDADDSENRISLRSQELTRTV